MTKGQFEEVISEQLEDDPTLQQWLLDEYDKMVWHGYLDSKEVKVLIVKIFKKEMFSYPDREDYINSKIKATIEKYQQDF